MEKIDAAGILRDSHEKMVEVYGKSEAEKPLESPMHAFPEEIQSLMKSWNECLGYHIEYLVLSILTAISTAIGTAQKIKVKNGWEQYAPIYGALVGKSGDNKSHPLRTIMKPIEEFNRVQREKYAKEMELYNKQVAEDKENKVTTTVKKPTCKKLKVGDITLEALYGVLNDNPHGVLMLMDELSYWLSNFSRYNKGSDEDFWVMAFDSGTWTKDRMLDNVDIPEVFVNVSGTIQYDILREQMTGRRRSSGFMARMLLAIPEKQKTWTLEDLKELPDYVESRWKEIVDEMLRRNMNGSKRLIKLSESAKKILYKWHSDNERYAQKLQNPNLASIATKQNTYIFRFCLLLHEIHEVCGSEESEFIDEDIARKAIILSEHYRNSGKVFLKVTELSMMPPSLQDVYNALDQCFTSDTINRIAMELNGMNDREARRYLETYNDVFYARVKRGEYIKIL